MNPRLPLLVVALWAGVAGATPLENQLSGHASPYLRLHSTDPVAWQDWGPAAVQQARKSNKLLYLSIGYFSCHWCHVMQRESYKNPDIAKALNENFVPVKIDRELNPALDSRMIDFAERTQGRAGWPLNVFITPDGHPLYAVLYLPRENFAAVLARLTDLWRDDREGLMRMAAQAIPEPAGPGKPELNPQQVLAYVQHILATREKIADPVSGGFGTTNKFPSTPQLDFLLDVVERKPDPAVSEFLRLTLDHMSQTGLWDHLDGGFFRYTVDPTWQTPHFEKMLYDNAQLAWVYRRAARILNVPQYAVVADQTLDFLLREMRRPSGAMVASFSAVDAAGVEGGYYLFDDDTLRKKLSADEYPVFRRRWGMTDNPVELDAGFLMVSGETPQQIATAKKVEVEKITVLLDSAAKKLRAERATRQLPVDDKLLAGWNALALTAFSRAAGEQPRFRQAATDLRDYLMNVLWDKKTLARMLDANAKPAGNASLEDYAFVAQGLWYYAELTGKPTDYASVAAVVDAAWPRFYSGGWRLGEDSLISDEPRRDAIADGPLASPSGVLIDISLRLAAKRKDAELRERALAALNSARRELVEDPFWFATHVSAMQRVAGAAPAEAATATAQ
ncbi:MAG: DUF255 domain-containing protein [Gammaproteobacteria bacterium]|nr:DUF255 domain-containing protein [Gammaproteobacteria bacterium]